MVYVVDRRINGRNRSAVNRERFMRRYKSQIREAVDRAVRKRSISDIENGEKISIPKRDISEPSFGHGKGGIWENVHPGNEKYHRGDRIARPQGGSGGKGKGEGSPEGEGEDDFVFQLSREEFLDYFFEDLALPNLVKTQLATIKEFKSQRAGFTADGTPTNIHVVRSMRGALARRIALGSPLDASIRDLEEEIERARDEPVPDTSYIARLEADVERLKARRRSIPWLDPFDLRYRNRVKVPKPSTRAVMICIMDVSGSMDENKKDLGKRFFTLLYLFLTRHYESVELVFVRHHIHAQEVDEDTFFHSRESGGTVVSSALELTRDIINARYSTADWNIYCAQASDGDNWRDDSPVCAELLRQEILPSLQFFAYVEIAETEPQNLWHEYAAIQESHPGQFAMERIADASHIWPVFRELFKRGESATR
jgi:uncharacterized protein